MSLVDALREFVNVQRCTGCLALRHTGDFAADKRKKCGLRSRCRECERAEGRARYAADPQKKLAMDARWCAANRDKANAKVRRWRESNPDYGKRWRDANKERHAAMKKDWRERNVERSRLANRIRHRRRQLNPTHRMCAGISASINQCLRGQKGGRKTIDMVGWSVDDLRAHLERQFTKGMAWDNYGHWHIDHIVPLASFTFSGPDDPELRRAWALPNLRPLWAAENRRKNAKVLFLI